MPDVCQYMFRFSLVKSILFVAGVCAASRVGYSVLTGGGNALDAVEKAVVELENNPIFNAGNYCFCL